ncbi:hypothetical protein [Aquicoccus porphyridii]|uniref:hypothetical protein n=1 Tax=Aquicoccus porphyridii TaxID=1852029 RepID=UPI00273FE366|nr:hypothetical protein [Aquicoccus porphyridii]
MKHAIPILLILALPGLATAQDHTAHGSSHDMTHGGDTSGDTHTMAEPADLREAGQSAFATIQEIVARLMAEPATDWATVDIEALRQHLIDMDNVTLRAQVETRPLDGGARFVVTSNDPAVTASIRAMVPAHAATMDGVQGWRLSATATAGGAILTATGPGDAALRIRGLGFIGLMTVGMHHQSHHLALATGHAPHAHQHRAQD